MGDPVTMAVVGGSVGAMMNKKDPLKGAMLGAMGGYALNPFQFMSFKQPNYKEFSFNWTLTPNSPQESETLKKIINQLKNKKK